MCYLFMADVCFMLFFTAQGFISAHAALASRDVDLVLIPEVNFELRGEHGILPHIQRTLERQGIGDGIWGVNMEYC